MRRVLIHTTYLRPGRVVTSSDITVTVRDGEGETRLDGNGSSDLGTLEDGTLVLSSPRYPRFAPLTLEVAGADLRFLVRRRKLVCLELVRKGDVLLRLACTGLWSALSYATLSWPDLPGDRVRVTRVNPTRKTVANEDWETPLDLHVVKGTIAPLEGFQKDNDGTVVYHRLAVRRAGDGEMILRFHGARMELDFAQGALAGLRVNDSRGPIANLRMVDGSNGGVSTTAALIDALP